MRQVYAPSVRQQSGLSLIELLISIALSSFLLFGVLQIYVSNKQTSRIHQSFSEMQESGRIATELLSRDIRMAGSWGCDLGITDITSKLGNGYASGVDPTDPMTVGIVARLGLHIQNDVAAATTVGGITVLAETDIITIRGSRAIANVKVIADMATTTSNITISGSVPQNTIVMISDCESADVFSQTTAGADIAHGTAGSTIANTGTALSKIYESTAQISIPFTREYFIGTVAGINSLFLRENGTTSELVRYVDDLDFVLAEDTDNDGSADVFNLEPTAAALADNSFRGVVSVLSSITVSSATNANGLASRIYSVTTNIRNRAL